MTTEIGVLCNSSNHLGGIHETCLPKDFLLLVLFLNCKVLRALPFCLESVFLEPGSDVFLCGPCSMVVLIALPQTAEVTLPIIRVISSMLGIYIM